MNEQQTELLQAALRKHIPTQVSCEAFTDAAELIIIETALLFPTNDPKAAEIQLALQQLRKMQLLIQELEQIVHMD